MRNGNKNKFYFSLLLSLFLLNGSMAYSNLMLEELPEKTIDSVDIRALVQQQIETARLSAFENEEIKETAAEQTEEEEELTVVSGSSYFDTTIIGLSAAFLFSLAGGLFYLLRKNKKNKEETSERKKFKENIKKIRNEKRIDYGNNHLQSIRTGLLGDVGNISGSAAVINYEARRRSISKGELYLAAKIKSFELSKIDNYR